MDTATLIDLVIVFASSLVVGTILRYAIPGRIKHGLLLVPGFAIVFSLLVWEISVWAGLPSEFGQVAWLILLVLTTGVTAAFTLIVVRRRTASDDTMLATALARVHSV
ncbi:MAG: hypothetical protein EBR52_00710 [Microbacteriaceae bacterium]|nr:hypothetical protein [Microbacteriaceae bacterium]